MRRKNVKVFILYLYRSFDVYLILQAIKVSRTNGCKISPYPLHKHETETQEQIYGSYVWFKSEEDKAVIFIVNFACLLPYSQSTLDFKYTEYPSYLNLSYKLIQNMHSRHSYSSRN